MKIPPKVQIQNIDGEQSVKGSSAEPEKTAAQSLPRQQPSTFELVSAQIRESRAVHVFENVVEFMQHAMSRLLPESEREGPARVVIYPGQFDPFHIDHLREVSGAIGEGEQAVVIPTAGAPGAQEGGRAPDWLRMMIAQTSTSDDQRIRVDNLALRHGFHTATAIIDKVSEDFPADTQLALLIGTDNYNNLSSWIDVEAMLEKVDLIVNHRPGDPIEDRLAALPKSIRADYRIETKDVLVNDITGRRIEFRNIDTQGTSSWDVLGAIQGDAGTSLGGMMAPAAQSLVESQFYPEVDRVERNTYVEFHRALMPKLEDIFGEDTGRRFSADTRLVQTLLQINPGAEDSTARVAEAVFKAARRLDSPLSDHPVIYSQGVKLAQSELFKNPASPKLSGAEQDSNQDNKQGVAYPSSTTVTDSPKAPSGGMNFLRDVLGPLSSGLSRLTARLNMLSPDDEALPMRSGSIGNGLSIEDTVTVYTGVGSSTASEIILGDGFASPADRFGGAGAGDKRIAENGLTMEVIDHLVGDSKQGIFVSASLDPAVARSYAGIGGNVFKSEIPASQVTFANDPGVWAHTTFRNEGNPEAFLHEVIVRRISPEFIRDVEQVMAVDQGVVKMRDYAGARMSLVLGAIGNVLRRLGR